MTWQEHMSKAEEHMATAAACLGRGDRSMADAASGLAIAHLTAAAVLRGNAVNLGK